MFKSLYVMMSYTTFYKWQLAAMAVGGGLVGMWWAISNWEKDYKSAKEAGVVA